MLSGSVIGLVRCWIVFHRHSTQRLRFHSGRFFEIAHAMARDEGISDAYLARLRTLVSDLDSPSNLRRLMNAASQIDEEIREGTFKPVAAGDRLIGKLTSR